MKKISFIKKAISLIGLTFFLGGCPDDARNTSIKTANSIREIAEEESKIILEYCVPRYEGAQTDEDVEATDKVCLPAKASYQAVKAAWNGLIIVLEKSKHSNEDNSEEIQKAVLEVINSLDELRKTIKEMQ